jgi:translation initiation factor 1A
LKRKVLSEEELKDLMLLGEGQVLGVVVKMLGFDRLTVKCDDGKERQCRISGKLKRRVWMREGMLFLSRLGSFKATRRATSSGDIPATKRNGSGRIVT